VNKPNVLSTTGKIKNYNHELQRNFFASLEIPNLGRSVGIKMKYIKLILIITTLFSCTHSDKYPITLEVYKSDLKEIKKILPPNEYTVNMSQPIPCLCGPLNINTGQSKYYIYGKACTLEELNEILKETKLHTNLNRHGVLLINNDSNKTEIDLLKLTKTIFCYFPKTKISIRVPEGKGKNLIESKSYKNKVSHTTLKRNVEESLKGITIPPPPPPFNEISDEPPSIID